MQRFVVMSNDASQYYTTEQLGPQRYKTPEGFLVCVGTPVARTGQMTYGPGETPVAPGPDGRVYIERRPDEVFAPDSIASLVGKPVTDDHPPVDVSPQNWVYFAKGVVLNPRRGDGENKDFLVADLMVWDEGLIDDINNGKRDVSCGYNPEYYPVLDGDDEEIPGRGEQTRILYNHLALVERGRCGPRCSIGDHKTLDTAYSNGANAMSKWRDRIRLAFRARDERALDEAMEGAEAELKEPALEIHNHIPDAAIGTLPEDPDRGFRPVDRRHDDARHDDRRHDDRAHDDEPPPWFKKFSEGNDARFKTLGDDIAAIKAAREGSDFPGENDRRHDDRRDDDRRHDDDMTQPGLEDPTLAMNPDARHDDRRHDDTRHDDRRHDDRSYDRRDEANKKILGELDFEAPPGTGDRARRAKDSVYLGDAFQDVVAKAEILAPGIRLPTFDRAAHPTKTFRVIDGLRRTALDLAYNQPETRGVVDAIMSGRPLNARTMDSSGIRVLFNAVAAAMADSNNRRSTDRSVHQPVNGGGLPLGGQLRSLADINSRNRERYGRRSA